MSVESTSRDFLWLCLLTLETHDRLAMCLICSRSVRGSPANPKALLSYIYTYVGEKLCPEESVLVQVTSKPPEKF